MFPCLSILSKKKTKKQKYSYHFLQNNSVSNYFCIPGLVLTQIKLFGKETELKMWMLFNMIGYLELFQRHGQVLFLYEVKNEALEL